MTLDYVIDWPVLLTWAAIIGGMIVFVAIGPGASGAETRERREREWQQRAAMKRLLEERAMEREREVARSGGGDEAGSGLR